MHTKECWRKPYSDQEQTAAAANLIHTRKEQRTLTLDMSSTHLMRVCNVRSPARGESTGSKFPSGGASKSALLRFLKLPAHRHVQDDDAYKASDIDPASTIQDDLLVRTVSDRCRAALAIIDTIRWLLRSPASSVYQSVKICLHCIDARPRLG